METFDSYHVALARPLPEMKKLADAMEEFHRFSFEEGMAAAKQAWGFAGEDLTRANADLLAAKCAKHGIKTTIIPSKEISSLRPVKEIEKTAISPSGLNWTTHEKETGFLSFESVNIIAAAPIKIETIKVQVSTEGPSSLERISKTAVTLTTGIPLGFGGKSKEVRKEIRQTELTFLLDIISTDERLRINSDKFDYTCLGKKKEYSSQLNFRVLLEELASFALKAEKNQGAQAILAKQPLNMLPYKTEKHLEKECRWMLTIKRFL